MTITAFPINTVAPTATLISSSPSGPVTATNVQVAIAQLAALVAAPGTIAASSVTNVPSGPITATNVQAALNQLAGLIPAPGPGTDPLFLTQGLDVTTFNGNLGNASERRTANFTNSSDSSNVHPDFSNIETATFQMFGLHGQNTYGPVTQVKESFFCTNTFGYMAGSGQKFLHGNRMNAFGMGDSCIHAGDNLTYAGGPVNGDEGQGWGSVSILQQQNFLTVFTITAKPPQSVINTTITQAVTRSEFEQTVTVASTAGAVVGDWVVIDQELPSAGINLEAVKITGFTGLPTPTIKGVFRCNHLINATVTPALRLTLDGTFGLGQDRVLINLSTAPGSSYSTGTVSSISGGGFTGTGTGWTIGMVGGNAMNIGAISLAADDYTLTPFNGTGISGALKSWYQINPLSSATLLGAFKTSVAGDGSYAGKGPGSGAYTIRPCARILRIVNSGVTFTGEVICETSTSTWNVGDPVEQVICPYPDVTGFQYTMVANTNGGTYRGFMNIRQGGPRKFNSCFLIDEIVARGPQTDGVAYDSIFDLTASAKQAIFIGNSCTTAAILIQASDTASAIAWGPGIATAAHIRLDSSNQALTFAMVNGYTPPSGQMIFANAGAGINPESNMDMMQWNGYIQLPNRGSNAQKILMDRVTDPVNYERSFMRWGAGNTFFMGVEKGGSGNLQDFAIMSGAVEQLRFVAADGMQISNPASFSANGSVATVLGSLGPAGASTTVQRWLKFKDDGGVFRYIPCF